MKKYLLSFAGAFVLGFFLIIPNVQAATSYSQTVTLASGWNVVSTPRILDSHSFSAAENSTNFDIYVLDATNPAGWSTMSTLGQTEFTPLYGYFINNKTGSNQTLTFNYKDNIAPNERLFSRTFSNTGWYSLGVANPTYALSQGDPVTPDINNVTNILSSLQSGDYSTAVDFTAGDFTTATWLCSSVVLLAPIVMVGLSAKAGGHRRVLPVNRWSMPFNIRGRDSRLCSVMNEQNASLFPRISSP
jgi:hypothetical protein